MFKNLKYKLRQAVLSEIKHQLAVSISYDIAEYINSYAAYRDLGVKWTKFYEGQEFVYSDIVTEENRSDCLNLELCTDKGGYEIYHIHNDELLLAILHYDDEIKNIICLVDAYMEKRLSE